jgi:hypothetical protein
VGGVYHVSRDQRYRLANHPDLSPHGAGRSRSSPVCPAQRHSDPRGLLGHLVVRRFPEHYAGDASSAGTEKGKKLQELALDGLTKFIKAVKEDTVTPALEREFFEREAKIRD